MIKKVEADYKYIELFYYFRSSESKETHTFAKNTIMGLIRLNNIRCYAYHGCLTEEAEIGSDYRVDLWVRTDFTEAAKTDKLTDTIDYVQLNKLVKTQMGERSNLLEQVVQRIIDQVLQDFPTVKEVGVALSKINPPLGGDVESVTVELTKTR